MLDGGQNADHLRVLVVSLVDQQVLGDVFGLRGGKVRGCVIHCG